MTGGLRQRIQRRCWDAHASGWNSMREEHDSLQQIEEAVDRIGEYVPPPARIVDLGCGAGQHAIAVSRAGYVSTAVDRSESMLALARANAVRAGVDIDFRAFDLEGALPFSAASFDGVLCVSVLQVLRDPAGFLGEVRRVLRPGGVVWIESVCSLGALSHGEQLSGRDRFVNGLKKVAVKVNRNAVREYQPPDVAELLSETGFGVASDATFDNTFAVVGIRPD